MTMSSTASHLHLIIAHPQMITGLENTVHVQTAAGCAASSLVNNQFRSDRLLVRHNLASSDARLAYNTSTTTIQLYLTGCSQIYVILHHINLI